MLHSKRLLGGVFVVDPTASVVLLYIRCRSSVSKKGKPITQDQSIDACVVVDVAGRSIYSRRLRSLFVLRLDVYKGLLLDPNTRAEGEKSRCAALGIVVSSLI